MSGDKRYCATCGLEFEGRGKGRGCPNDGRHRRWVADPEQSANPPSRYRESKAEASLRLKQMREWAR